MKSRELRVLLARRPFKPFTISTRSGERIVVRHPENLMVGDQMAAVRGKFEGEEVITVLFTEEIVSMQYAAERARPDGRRKR